MSTDSSTQRVVVTTLTDLHAGPSFHTELLTQVTNGLELDILKTEGEWCHVRQRDGYEGWAYRDYLGERPVTVPTPTHYVTDLVLPLHALEDVNAPIVARVPIGTAVSATQRRDDWAHITLVGDAVPSGWAMTDGLRLIPQKPLPADAARQQIVADARRLTGVHYVWGGNSASGIDCSGLAQLSHRLAGYELPRDARLQFPVGKVVEAPFKPGDLLFFHGETNKEKITHVGISTGGWHMIHSSRSRNGVYEEDLQSDACRNTRERFVGARSFL